MVGLAEAVVVVAVVDVDATAVGDAAADSGAKISIPLSHMNNNPYGMIVHKIHPYSH